MKVKVLLFAVAMWSIDLLFCLCNLFFTSHQTSNVLMLVSAGMAVTIGICFLVKKSVLITAECKTLLFPLVLLCGLLLTILLRGGNALAISVLKCFICYAIPMTLLAIVAYDDNDMLLAGRYTDFILLLFNLYLIYILRNGVLSQTTVQELQSESNIGYQSTSYFGAYAFVLSLYALLFVKVKGNIFKKGLLYAYRAGTMVLSLLVAVYGGGKGAIVVIALTSILLISLYLNNSKRFVKFLGICIGAVVVLWGVSKVIGQNDALSQSFDRIYALFGTGTVDYYTTSGRTVRYENCFKAFRESPIIGHGIAGAYYIGIGQPHQMFLEILVEGGLVYLGVWLFILYYTCRRIVWLLKNDQQHFAGYVFLIVTFVAQIIGLQFSGFYMQSYTLWFFIAYVNLRVHYLRKEKNSICAINLNTT